MQLEEKKVEILSSQVLEICSKQSVEQSNSISLHLSAKVTKFEMLNAKNCSQGQMGHSSDYMLLIMWLQTQQIE